jgi:RNA polymerase sigma factor (TIGR02999 family)
VSRTRTTVTRLLGELAEGDRGAEEEIFRLLYGELQAIARRHRRRWRGNETLDTTALVHEAYLKLVGQEGIGAESRARFLALAATAMRHVLCNYARGRNALKRGGGGAVLTLDEARAGPAAPEDASDRTETLLALDVALGRLEEAHPRAARAVELRFFGGLSLEETAAALGVSARTVQRDWILAQAWLHREMSGDAPSEGGLARGEMTP